MARDRNNKDKRTDQLQEFNQGEQHLDRRWAWVVMVAALLTHILTFGAAYASVGALYVEFLKAFGRSESATSLTGSIMLGTMLCSGPLASILAAKFGARAVGVCGGIFAASGLMLSALANGLVCLYFTFGFLTGLGYGLSYLPCIVMLGNFFEKKRAVASGIAVSGSGLGTFIFAPLAQSLLETFGYRGTLIALGGIELLLCICGATYMPSKIPVRTFQQARTGVDVTGTESVGGLTTGSILESNTPLARLSDDVSILTQAAICASGLSFRGQSRSLVKQTDSVATTEDVETSTPPNQLSDGSILAQAALCLSRLSPSISSSAQSSSSEKMLTPVITGSPVTIITEEFFDKAELSNNEDTLVPRHKSEFPPIPEEFIINTAASIRACFDTNDSVATMVSAANTSSVAALNDFPKNVVTSKEEGGKTTTEVMRSVKNSNEYVKSTDKPLIQTPEHCDRDVITPVIHINDNHFETNDAISSTSSIVCPKTFSNNKQVRSGCLEPFYATASLFKTRFFVLFCLSNLLVCIGYQLPYMYFNAFALSLGLGEGSWALILAIMGITDTLGRIIVGFCFDYVTTDIGRLLGFSTSMIISGAILCLTSLADSYASLMCFAAAFALVAGSTDSLVAALLVGYVGLDMLGYSFGMSIEMQGIGFIAGPPIAGLLYSVSGTYTAVFCTGGVAFILSGLVLLLEPFIAFISNGHVSDQNIES